VPKEAELIIYDPEEDGEVTCNDSMNGHNISLLKILQLHQQKKMIS